MGSTWKPGIHSNVQLKETLHLLPWMSEEAADKTVESKLDCNCSSIDNKSSICNCDIGSTSMDNSNVGSSITDINSSDCGQPSNSYLKTRHISVDSAR